MQRLRAREGFAGGSLRVGQDDRLPFNRWGTHVGLALAGCSRDGQELSCDIVARDWPAFAAREHETEQTALAQRVAA